MIETTSPPAGGAEIAQVMIATGAAVLLTIALMILGLGHRSGRITLLRPVAAFSERVSGLPAWAAIPAAVATVSLLSAVFGYYWDVALHIDNGRDPGPLANPSHYFILAGLFGIMAAGWLAMVLPERGERPGRAAISLTRDWHAPLSGVLMAACASFALIGFPLDDVSHRLFGQDVTLWGTTHLMMLSGAALTLIAIMGLLTEGRLARPDAPRSLLGSDAMRRARLVAACGGLLIGLSIYQGEFDYGVPQWRLLNHPVLIAAAAAIALVAARTLAGRGAALAAVAFFIVVRGTLTLLVGPVFGESIGHFPLYLAEAGLVEAVALVLSPARPYRFGVVAGALVGSVGVLAEYVWSHVWMPYAWPAHILPEAIALSVLVGVAGGVIGAFLAGGIRVRPDVSGVPRAWVAATASVLAIGGTLAYLARTTVPDARASVELTEVRGAPERTVHATVRFDPPLVAEDADWLATIDWQGEAPLLGAPLERVGDGVYRTSEPLPVHGSWKSAIRLHRGSDLASIPVYMPGDDAIPAAEIPAPARFERALTADRKILQRERKEGVSEWLVLASAAVVLGLAALLLGFIGWALARLARAAPAAPERAPRPALPVEHELAGVA